ncbi:MAG TPA: hypothetical protein VG406_25465 [Isosphaeraceae bacterium]|jgi:hypothetical protein|nr:hypothetical protein [Isosphaeraceae bacterium]
MPGLRHLAALALITLPVQAFAQGRPTVRIKTVRGSEITGTIAQDSIRIDGDLGPIEVPLGKVKSIEVERFSAVTETPDRGLTPRMYSYQKITTRKGDRIVGTIEKPLRIESDLGTLSIEGDIIETIEIISPDRAGSRGPSATPQPDPEVESKPATAAPKDADGSKGSPTPTERAARPSPIPRSILRPGTARVTRLKAPAPPRRPIRMANQGVVK